MKGIVQGSTVTGIGTAVAADLLDGKTAKSDIGPITGSMVNKAATNIQASFAADVDIPIGFYNGTSHALKPILAAGTTYIVHFSNTVYAGGSELWSIQSTTYTETNYHSFIMGYSGTIRIIFTLTAMSASYAAYGRIYIGETPVGTERSTTSTGGTTFTEDITVVAGDYINIRAKVAANGGGYAASVTNVYAKTIQPLICSPALHTANPL